MTNNEVLRRVQSLFGLTNAKIVETYKSLDDQLSEAQVELWFKKDSDADFLAVKDVELSTFLNALICEKRGRKEEPQPEPEKKITNNVILKKLKIALNLKNEDVLDILKLANRTLSGYELTAFFRKPSHKNYRPFKDHLLKDFLQGLEFKSQSQKS